MGVDVAKRSQESSCGSIEVQDLSFSYVRKMSVISWVPPSSSAMHPAHPTIATSLDENKEENGNKEELKENSKGTENVIDESSIRDDMNSAEEQNRIDGVIDLSGQNDISTFSNQARAPPLSTPVQSKRVMLMFNRIFMSSEKDSDSHKLKKHEKDKAESNGKVTGTNDKTSVLPKVSEASVNENQDPLKTSSDRIIRTVSDRFTLLIDGTHFHTLRRVRREEKLRSMLRDFLGGNAKKEARMCALDNTPQANNLSLINGCMNKMKSERSDLSKKEKDYTNTSASLVQKYGKCHEVIGKGAFGVVRISHKADPENAHAEQLYAIKEFRRRPSESTKKYTKRLTSEFCISSSLRHPNVIHTLDLLQDSKGDYCEVMEFCAGGDLYSLILASGKLDMIEADCYFKQLMRGVEYMHEMGVAHRDLKPENLLLTHNGALKITDFGNGECFRMAWEKKAHLTCGLCGSIPYIAPEEYTDKEFDPRAVDVWATGVIYMAMRTGRHLWRVAKQDEDDFYDKYLEERKNKAGYEPIESLQRTHCRNVIYSILDPSPERRISAKHVLRTEWGKEILVCKAGEVGF
ncbi:uncharacterized protein T551_02656 [Pneumocystis jirovecii RU7]|uniref:non-specific serine/threonine protein kinase n=1 Tax=Pneumocystis jirovecii (strain RU7) TaxID=1408657 RepID=A0A0W4ZIN1_PNEJ7|nr:uncharacterized protein T551_02656 [Pneumocystis jirovecii RU7]KTW28237.1 hypothetical protein T551_02656 [Pneumocystis jirovecii RU7]